MASKNINIDDHSIRTLEKTSWREYLTMPNIRKLDCPEYRIFSVPLKEAGRGRPLEMMWDESRSKRCVRKKKVVEVENLSTMEALAKSVNSTSQKSQMARLNRHIDLGLKVAESDLEKKRNKLKALILKEETDLTHEYIDKAQKMAADLLEKKKLKVEEILKNQARESEEQAKIRYEQQERENSDYFKAHVCKQYKIESAEVQKHQICEKMLQKERELEFEKFWVELIKKQDDERRRYEEQEKAIRLTKIQELREVLNKQIVGKKMMEEEMKMVKEHENKFIDELKERIRKEDELEKEFALQKKLELRKMKFSELEENQRIRMEKAAIEKAFDDYYSQRLAESIEEEKVNKTDLRAQLKREADFFRQQLKEINAAKKEEERQIEALRKEEVDKKEAVIIRNLELIKEANEKIERETLETRKQQLLHKKKMLESEKEIQKMTDNWSDMMLNKNKDLDKMEEEYIREQGEKHQDDLDLQIKYGQLLHEREIQSEKDFLKEKNEMDMKKKEIWKSLKTFAHPHPFSEVLRK